MGRLQPPFVGDGRQKVVEGLAALLADAQLREQPIWVSIEAPSGWGKTRVAHAFYERLAMQQAKRYWPPTILDATDARFFDVASRRKRVFPEPQRFDREAGSLPELFWWGVACEQRGGAPTQVLLQDLAQLETHAPFLEAAWSALASIDEKHGLSLERARELAAALVDEAAGEGLGKLTEKLFGAAVPGLGLAVDLAKFGFGKAREEWQIRQTIAQPGALSVGGDLDIVSQAVETLTRIARPGLPVILFVEDLHRDTGLVAALLGQLLASNAPAMILTTTWPGEIEQSQELAALLANPATNGRVVRLQHNMSVPENFPAGASMDALPTDALKQLIRAYYPATSDVVLDALAARYNNPLPIELICTFDRHRRAGQDGALHLTAEEIEKLPRTVEKLYRDLWEELPVPVRCVLALSTLAIPASNASWHRNLVQNAVAAVAGRIGGHDAPQPIGGTVPHGWVREIETWLRRFNEPDQMHIAQQEVEDRELFGDDVMDDFLAALAAAVIETPLPMTPWAGDEDQHRAWLALSLHPTGLVSNDFALDAVLQLLRALPDGPADIPVKLSLAPILAALPASPGDERSLDARAILARNLAEGAKRTGEAIAMFEALLADCRATHGDDHPAVDERADELSLWLLYSGDRERAIAIQREIVEAKLQRRGKDDVSTIKASLVLANTLLLSLQREEGLTLLLRANSLLRSLAGEDHDDAVFDRRMNVWSMSNGGWAITESEHAVSAGFVLPPLAEAIAIFSDAIPRLRALLGEDDSHVTNMRQQLMWALVCEADYAGPDGAEARLADVIALQDSVIATLLRLRGPDEREVLTLRVERLQAMAKRDATIPDEDVERITTEATLLIDDIRRSEQDQATLVARARNALADILLKNDQIFEFVNVQSERMAEMSDNPSANDQARWDVIDDVIYWFEKVAVIEEEITDDPMARDMAIDFRELLIESRAAKLGDDHFDVMRDRIALVRSLIMAERLDEAQSLHRDFLASPGRTAVDGRADLYIKRKLAGREFREAGVAEEEVAALAALIEDEARAKAPDIAKLQDMRGDLADALTAAGDRDGALALYRPLLTELTDMYGPTSDISFATTNRLTALLPPDEATQMWRDLLEARRTVLGKDHPLVTDVQDILDALTRRTIH